MRVRAYDSSTATYSSYSTPVNMSTNTISIPTTPTGLAETSDTTTSVTMSWNSVASGGCGDVTNYIVKRGTTTIYDGTATSTTDSGLACGTASNTYTVTAYNTAGSSAASGGVVMAVQAATAPATPTGLAETSDTVNSISMSWNAVTSDCPPTSYRVNNGTSDVYDGTATSFTDTGLACGTASYTYTVTAYNDVGSSAPSAGVVMAVEADITAPTVPTNFAQTTPLSTTDIWVTWSLSTDDCSGIYRYNFYVGANSIGNDTTPTSGFISYATPGSVIAMTIDAEDNAGNKSAKSSPVNMCTLCIAPTLVYESKTSTSITLSWAAVNGASSYKLYWSDNVGGEGGSSGSISNVTSQYTHTPLSNSTEYTYNLVAINACGDESADSNTIIQTTNAAGDTQAPTVPTGLFSTIITTSSFRLNWIASTDDTAVTGYKVFKNGSLYATLGNVTSTDITGQSQGSTATWTVSAFDAVPNESAQSTGLSVTIGVSVNAISMTSTGYSLRSTACAQSTSTTRYITGPDSTPSNGDIIYKFSNGTGPIIGNGLYYSDGSLSFTVDSFGVVGNVAFCII
jgi:hypothetical protein